MAAGQYTNLHIEVAMKRAILMQFILGTVLLAMGWADALAAGPCDEQTSRLVSRAYILSIPLLGRENDLISLMRSSPSSFGEDGRAIQCMRVLGSAMTRQGLAQAQPSDRDRASRMFGGSMPEGLEHLPGQVDQSLNSYSNGPFEIGQELLWLAQVLPPAAQGDYAPYNTTGTFNRRMMRQVLPQFQLLCQMQPSACQMMMQMMSGQMPALENMIFNLARQAGG